MQKILKFLSKETRGLHQAAFILAFGSIGAKALAILRDRLLASNFGAGKTLDVYYASFRLPDLLYVFSLFLVSVTALIPLFLEKKKISIEESKRFINSVFTVFFVFLVFLTAVSFFAVPYITSMIAPGFSGEDKDILIKLSRILLLSPLFLGFSNLVAGIIQSFRRFFVYALSGVLYNVGIIFGLLFLEPIIGLKGVVCGVIIGAFAHFAIQLPSLVSLGYFPRFTRKIDFSGVKQVLNLSFPRALGLALNQLVLMAMTAVASLLAVGSIAVFNLASNLQTIPLGVIALSYSVAAFPSLARSFIKKEKEEFLSSISSSFSHIIFWLLPFTALFVVLRAQIVRVILGAGVFTWADTRLTAAALALFSFSLFAQGIVLLLVRAFYAAGKTKIPLIVNIISSFVIVISSVAFLSLFKNCVSVGWFFKNLLRVGDVSGASVLALPLAYSIGMILNFILLFVFFEKEFGGISLRVKKSALQVTASSVLSGATAYFFLSIFARIFNLDIFFGIFMQGFLAGILALFAGFVFLKLTNNRELKEITLFVRKKFSYVEGKKIVAKPEPEELP
ncbi:hypothetical protein KKA27_00760 [Patescibacteria group bacterium]|nr:hypothetical protein [Patescibacteria group bacterium]